MKTIKFAIMALGVALALSSCNTSTKRIIVSNSLDVDRNGELVYAYVKGTEERPFFSKGFMLLDDNGEQVPWDVMPRDQINDPYSATIVFQADVPAGGKVTYTLQQGKRNLASLVSRVGGDIYFNRYNDFAWENDRVGFRAYHQYLIPVDGPSNGVDILAKRTEELVWPEFYANGDYHNDHGKGLDFYKVGRTLGGGAMAPMVDTAMVLGENYDQSPEILVQNRMVLKFKLKYRPLMVGENIVLEERTYTLEAGSQMNKVEVEYVGMPAGSTVAAGIAAREPGCAGMASGEGWVAYEDNSDPANGTIFVGLYNPAGWDKAECAKGHVLAYTKVDDYAMATYYQGAGWSKWGFDDYASWQKYMSDFGRRLENPLEVIVR